MIQPKVGDLVKHRGGVWEDNMYIVVRVGFVCNFEGRQKELELELLQCATNKIKFCLAKYYEIISAS